MNISLNLWSDAASLCFFDPTLCEGEKSAEMSPSHRNSAVREGLFSIVSLQGDGQYLLRLTDTDLTLSEREAVNDVVGPIGVAVRSGRLYVSGMDLPGEPEATYRQHGAGAFVEIPGGDYDVHVYEMRSAAVEHGLPDYVAIIRLRNGPFACVTSETRFCGGRDHEDLMKELMQRSPNDASSETGTSNH